MNPEDIVDVQEAANAFEDMFDDNLELIEDEPTDDNIKEVADAIEEDLDDVEEDEDESDEDEPDTDDDDGSSDDDDSDDLVDDDESTKLIDITIDGEEYEVNLPELKAGYLRNEDFVKRSAELESQHSARMAELSQKEAQLAKEIEASAVIAMSDLSKYENMDWAKLKAEDPAKYATEFSEFMEKRQEIQAQIARRNTIHEMQNKAAALKHEAFLNEQLVLARKLIPEFDDPGFKTRIFKYAESIGITQEEVANIADARHLLLLGEAMKHSESQLKKKSVVEKRVKVEELPPVVKPGAKKPAGSATAKRQKALEARLTQSGSIRDAAAAFEAFI